MRVDSRSEQTLQSRNTSRLEENIWLAGHGRTCVIDLNKYGKSLAYTYSLPPSYSSAVPGSTTSAFSSRVPFPPFHPPPVPGVRGLAGFPSPNTARKALYEYHDLPLYSPSSSVYKTSHPDQTPHRLDQPSVILPFGLFSSPPPPSWLLG